MFFRSVAVAVSLSAALAFSRGPAFSQVPGTVAEADSLAIEGPSISPRGAFFRSILLPGWGQVYVGAPGRGAAYFSLAAGSVWMAYVARRQYADARAQQDWLRRTGELGPAEETGLVVARSQHFEDWAALSLFLFFFSGADAYVAAYLVDFDVGVGSAPDNSLQLRASIPLPSLR